MNNDTYESVCSPDDIADRAKLAQRRHSTMTQNHHQQHHQQQMNNGRLLKRVVSAPIVNESKGN